MNTQREGGRGHRVPPTQTVNTPVSVTESTTCFSSRRRREVTVSFLTRSRVSQGDWGGLCSHSSECVLSLDVRRWSPGNDLVSRCFTRDCSDRFTSHLHLTGGCVGGADRAHVTCVSVSSLCFQVSADWSFNRLVPIRSCVWWGSVACTSIHPFEAVRP